MLCCETLSQWVYRVYMFISYSTNPTQLPPSRNPSSSSPLVWQLTSQAQSKYRNEVMSFRFPQRITCLVSKMIKKKNILHESWRFDFLLITRCSFSLVQEMGSCNHAEHYQVYKNNVFVEKKKKKKRWVCHIKRNIFYLTKQWKVSSSAGKIHSCLSV